MQNELTTSPGVRVEERLGSKRQSRSQFFQRKKGTKDASPMRIEDDKQVAASIEKPMREGSTELGTQPMAFNFEFADDEVENGEGEGLKRVNGAQTRVVTQTLERINKIITQARA